MINTLIELQLIAGLVLIHAINQTDTRLWNNPADWKIIEPINLNRLLVEYPAKNVIHWPIIIHCNEREDSILNTNWRFSSQAKWSIYHLITSHGAFSFVYKTLARYFKIYSFGFTSHDSSIYASSATSQRKFACAGSIVLNDLCSKSSQISWITSFNETLSQWTGIFYTETSLMI